MGRPLPGYDVVLVDSYGHEVAEGEISLKLDPHPLGLMPGYYSEDGTTVPVRGEIYRTGTSRRDL